MTRSVEAFLFEGRGLRFFLKYVDIGRRARGNEFVVGPDLDLVRGGMDSLAMDAGRALARLARRAAKAKLLTCGRLRCSKLRPCRRAERA